MSENQPKSRQWTPVQLTLVALAMVAAVAVGVLAILWQINSFSMQVILNGDREITMEYGEQYEEQGAQAVFQGSIFMKEPSAVDVIIRGELDVNKVGTYYITYSSSRYVESIFGNSEARDSVRRTIHVVDTQAPVITLVADPEVYTLPGQVYVEEGFTATDDYDGDLTARVVRTDDGEKVTYRVTDSSGNTAEVVRVIVYNDPVAPELNLEGKETMTLELGKTFQEPGFTANDNCDGDITTLVEVTGTVDTAKTGTYTLTYTVKDAFGNETVATRTVKVVEPATEATKPKETKPKETTAKETKPKETTGKVDIEGNGGVIYLTFDDGPSSYTPKLLDILAKHNVKATFFVVDTAYIHLASRIASEGHTLAIHTATHNFKEIYASEEAYFADLEVIKNQIIKYSGQTPTLLRFPGGGSNTVSKKYCPGIMTRLTKLVEEKGYTYFDWNVDSDDAGSARTATTVYNNVVKGCANRKTSVVLMHDIKGYSVNAVEDIILWGKANGYTFKALTASSPTFHHRVMN